jgi:hypothetical protein
MKLQIYALPICLFVFLSLASAQTPFHGSITGQVFDASTKRPLEFVNVVLHQRADSSMVTGTTTDKTGQFVLPNVPGGEYYCTLFLIGSAPCFVIQSGC